MWEGRVGDPPACSKRGRPRRWRSRVPVWSAFTPLMATALCDNLAETEVLLAQRAKPHLRGRFLASRGTALDIAKKFGCSAVQALLQEAWADEPVDCRA